MSRLDFSKVPENSQLKEQITDHVSMGSLGEGYSAIFMGLFPRSYQGDSRGTEIFAKLGVRTTYTDRGVVLTKTGTPVARLEEDLVDIPDLAQTLVTTCAFKNIAFRFSGLQSLKLKDTDRIEALKRELKKLG